MLKHDVLYWINCAYAMAATYAPVAERLRARCRLNPVWLQSPPPCPQGVRVARTVEIVGAMSRVAVQVVADSRGHAGYAAATDTFAKQSMSQGQGSLVESCEVLVVFSVGLIIEYLRPATSTDVEVLRETMMLTDRRRRKRCKRALQVAQEQRGTDDSLS